MTDRTVHARSKGMEVVRYDRSGKWYLEPTNPRLPRRAVSIDEAVAAATWALAANGAVYRGLPGGSAFDRKLHRKEAPAGVETPGA